MICDVKTMSVKKGDRVFPLEFGRYRVFLNGEEQQNVLTADDEKGLVRKMVIGSDGNYVLSPDSKEVLAQVLHGKVFIQDTKEVKVG